MQRVLEHPVAVNIILVTSTNGILTVVVAMLRVLGGIRVWLSTPRGLSTVLFNLPFPVLAPLREPDVPAM